MLASLWSKSLTVDEPTHAAAGYAYWTFNDYRLNPENGNLPQRWMALPLLGSRFPYPSTATEAWRKSDEGTIGERWFDGPGNDPAKMARRGRAFCGAFAVALGGLVWWWSRALFGPIGGMLSLLLFVLNPSILANGALMTSDMACALFFLASTLGAWGILHRISVGRLAFSTLATAGLFLSKMSAPLIVPIAIALGIVRIFAGPPIRWEIGKRRRLASRRARLIGFVAVFAAHLLVAAIGIWAFNGFRYRPFGPHSPAGSAFDYSWSQVLEKPDGSRPLVGKLLDEIRIHRLLPEAYIFGVAHVWRDGTLRRAFLNGQMGVTGWWWFFPYSFLVKTPPALFGIIGLAALAARRVDAYRLLPLLFLLGVYWATAISSHINIGHRHILATYPPLFVLCGAAGSWIRALSIDGVSRSSTMAGWGLFGLLVALVYDAASTFPNYLSYFNVFSGGASGAYRHLVDSSLDWGQDLPSLKRYLDAYPKDHPVFLSYFGVASPNRYGIRAGYLYSIRGQDIPRPMKAVIMPSSGPAVLTEVAREYPDYEPVAVRHLGPATLSITLLEKPSRLRLSAGTYFISATMLQPVTYDLGGPLGPWNERFEQTYQILLRIVRPLLSNDRSIRDAALPTYTLYEWELNLYYFEEFRFARLTAYLRSIQPDGNINGSILIYHIEDGELDRALNGPPAEMGRDLPVESGLFRPPVGIDEPRGHHAR
jgi:hypothetical protein